MRTVAMILSAAVVVAALASCSFVSTGVSASASAVSGSTGQTVTPSASTLAVQTISPADAKKLLDEGNGTVLVDVRTEAEYTAGHIAGSILIPLESIAADAPAKLPDKTETIIVYCRTGIRAGEAAKMLMGMGYEHVFSIAGGINAWTYGAVKD